MQPCPYKLLVAIMTLAHEVSFHLLFIKLLAVAENLTDFILKCPRLYIIDVSASHNLCNKQHYRRLSPHKSVMRGSDLLHMSWFMAAGPGLNDSGE